MKRLFEKYKILLSALLLVVVCVGGTLAYLKASDTPVVNTFALANVRTEIVEEGKEESKIVNVKNNGSSDAFVRCRIVVSAGISQVKYETAKPETPDADTIYVVEGTGWEKAADGYYYYQGLLAEGNTTATPVISAVYTGAGIDADDFDVIVYAESVLGSGTYSLDKAQAAFNKVT